MFSCTSMTRRRLTLSGILAALLAAWYLNVPPAARAGALPDRLNPREFWKLSGELSEAPGYFRSDNLLSNEIWMQHVIPDLLKTTQQGRVYVGVGPEQNFTYIAAIRPAMVFIVDVRRGNLQLHLMYKALFELSADRADFVGRLFAKKRPAMLTSKSSVVEIFNAFAEVPTSEAIYKANLAAIKDHLVSKRGIPLEEEDLSGIENVTYQFYWFGPDITYSSNGGRFGRSMPRYVDLMLSTDGVGQNRSYLATEESFQFVKSLHERNLFVPVVGNFGGPKALRAVGRYVRDQGSTVAAFYLSNVEQYLNQQGLAGAFCENVATMPLDPQSTFIRSQRGGSPGGFNGFGGGFGYPGLVNVLANMQTETKECR
jgi:hypothetical protein